MPATKKKGGSKELTNLTIPFGLLLAKQSLEELSKSNKVIPLTLPAGSPQFLCPVLCSVVVQRW